MMQGAFAELFQKKVSLEQRGQTTKMIFLQLLPKLQSFLLLSKALSLYCCENFPKFTGKHQRWGTFY